MSKDRVEVHLGGTKYLVPMMNIGQLERVQDLFEESPKKSGFGVLKIALERAEPKIEGDAFKDVAATHKEIKTAVDKILELSGFDMGKPDPNAKAPAA